MITKSPLANADLLREQAWLNGEWVDADSGETFPVINPSTGETLAEVPRMGGDETRRALAAAEPVARSVSVAPRHSSRDRTAWMDRRISQTRSLSRV